MTKMLHLLKLDYKINIDETRNGYLPESLFKFCLNQYRNSERPILYSIDKFSIQNWEFILILSGFRHDYVFLLSEFAILMKKYTTV